VVNGDSGTVTPIATATKTAGTPITVGSQPVGLAITPNGKYAYVANSGSNTVTRITVATNSASKTITVGSGPRELAVTPDGSTLYVANGGANTVTPVTIATSQVGAPIAVGPWLHEQRARHGDPFALPRPERLALVQALADRVLARVGALIPVTPVPLACAAVQSFDADFIPRDALLRRMAEMRDVLLECNARVLRADRGIAETFDRAWRMLSMRRILVEQGDGFAVLPGQRALVSYYANSIAHLLGPFEAGVRQSDMLPALQLLASRR
jgi:YVTN family beta-propeller protein